jgi:hypothetical protein
MLTQRIPVGVKELADDFLRAVPTSIVAADSELSNEISRALLTCRVDGPPVLPRSRATHRLERRVENSEIGKAFAQGGLVGVYGVLQMAITLWRQRN